MMNKENEDNSTKKSNAELLKEEYQQQQSESEEDRFWEATEKEVNKIKEEVKEKEEEEKRAKKKDIEEYDKSLENEIFKENSFIRKAITEQEKFEEKEKRERDKKEKEKELKAKAEADHEKSKIRTVKEKIDEEIEDYKRKNNSSYNYFNFKINNFRKEVYFFVKFKTKKDLIYIIEKIKDESFNKYETDSEILAYYENKVIEELLLNFYKLDKDKVYTVISRKNQAFDEEINRQITNEKRIQERSKKNKEERIEREKREEKERIEREREELKQKREREKQKEREEKERIERENKRFINKLKRFFKLSK